MKILYDNPLDDCTISGSERSGFPMTNVQHIHLSRRWRSLTLSAEALLFNAGAGNTIDIDTFAIIQHNFSATASVKLQMNSADDWTTPPVDETLTWSAGIIAKFFTSTKSYQYLRVLITDAANADGYLEIGRIMAGLHLYLYQPLEGILDEVEDSTVVSISITGQPFADLGTVARVYEVPLGTIPVATRTAIKALYTAMGKHTPMVVFPDEADPTTFPPIYALLMEGRIFKHAGSVHWDCESLRFKEAF
jgi:hypothetical protein